MVVIVCRMDDGSSRNGAASAAPAPAEAAAAEAVEGSASAAQKLLRALQKKLRQCEALQERQTQGDVLTGPELEKLGKVPAWCVQLSHGV